MNEMDYAEATVHQLPKKKQVMRLVTKTGLGFDFDVPPDFDMAVLMTSVKANGHMMNKLFYVPIDNIGTIFLYQADTPPKDSNNVVKFPELDK